MADEASVVPLPAGTRPLDGFLESTRPQASSARKLSSGIRALSGWGQPPFALGLGQKLGTLIDAKNCVSQRALVGGG
jgi:hypothetical protein